MLIAFKHRDMKENGSRFRHIIVYLENSNISCSNQLSIWVCFGWDKRIEDIYSFIYLYICLFICSFFAQSVTSIVMQKEIKQFDQWIKILIVNRTFSTESSRIASSDLKFGRWRKRQCVLHMYVSQDEDYSIGDSFSPSNHRRERKEMLHQPHINSTSSASAQVDYF